VPYLGVWQALLPNLLAAAKVDCDHLQLPPWLARVHEVGNAGVQAAQHKVVWLHITIADGACMAVCQELQHTSDDGCGLKL
jgi:hypothetical protein